jgi:hypothetical protein
MCSSVEAEPSPGSYPSTFTSDAEVEWTLTDGSEADPAKTVVGAAETSVTVVVISMTEVDESTVAVATRTEQKSVVVVSIRSGDERSVSRAAELTRPGRERPTADQNCRSATRSTIVLVQLTTKNRKRDDIFDADRRDSARRGTELHRRRSINSSSASKREALHDNEGTHDPKASYQSRRHVVWTRWIVGWGFVFERFIFFEHVECIEMK